MSQRVRWSEYWFLYGQTFRQMGRPVLWLPVILHGLLAFAVVQMHLYLFSPVTGPLVGSWARLFSPEYADSFFHYPAQFVILPYYFGNARLIINIFLEALLFGVLIDLFIAVYRGQKPALAVSFKHAFRRYFSLTLVWFVVIAILYAVNYYFNDFVEQVIGYSLQNAPRRQMMASMAVRALTVLVYMPCLFLLPSIMAGGRTLGGSIKRALAVFGRHPFISLGLVLVPYLIGVLPSWASGESQTIVGNFYPELVYYLILISIAVDVIVNFILLGTSVKFFMDQAD